jgi:RNA recognition motif-containing protein
MGLLSWKTSSKQTPTNGVEDNHRMSFTVFLGNLPAWVTADDIKGWLTAENLVADAIKVIRNPETQESKGFAFIDAPNTDEMNAIIRRFDRAPLEDRLLRANPAQPPKPKSQGPPGGRPNGGSFAGPGAGPGVGSQAQGAPSDRPPRRTNKRTNGIKRATNSTSGPASAFAEELSKVL